jgi:cytochrome c oxidase cbb3-type subunit III
VVNDVVEARIQDRTDPTPTRVAARCQQLAALLPRVRVAWGASCGLVALLAFALGCSRGSDATGTDQASSALATASVSSAKIPQSSAERGAVLYTQYCQLCHGVGAHGYAADNAPSLVTQTFLESATDSFLARAIRGGRPNTAMAGYSKLRGGPLSETEVGQLVAYIRSLGAKYKPLEEAPMTGNVASGADVYSEQCQTCHGTQAQRGNALSLFNPELLSAATPGFLRYAILNGRAPTPMLPLRDKLTPQQVEDVVAWLWSMRPASAAPLPSPPPVIPKDLPMIINPKGKAPAFELREGRFVSAAQVAKALSEKRKVVILDARAPSDWLQVHIPGAVPVAYYDHESLSRVPNDGTWVIAYCACPHHASGEVVDALRAKGYPHTAVLDEGILYWRDHGYPVVGESATAPSATPSASAPRLAPAPSAGSKAPKAAPSSH